MSKRFTATEKWEKQWYRKLAPVHKCLWQYLCDKCDIAGVWEPDFELASMQIGAPVTGDDLRVFGDRLRLLENGKIYLLSFVEFQYGKLSKDCRPHGPVFALLQKHFGASIPYVKGIDRVSGRAKEQEPEKEKEPEPEWETEEDWFDPRYELPGYNPNADTFRVLTDNQIGIFTRAIEVCRSIPLGRSNVAHHDLVAAFKAAGHQVTVEWVIPDRGDGKGGRIDLVVDKMIAIEADGTRPKKKSVMKLRQFKGIRLIVLGNGKWEGEIPGIHAVVWAESQHAGGVEILRPTLDQLRAAAATTGLPDAEIEACWNHYQAQGWKRANGMAVTDLPAIIANWKRKFEEKRNEQRNGKNTGNLVEIKHGTWKGAVPREVTRPNV